MECVVVSFESILRFCFFLSLVDKGLLCVLSYFRRNFKSFSCLSEVISHRKDEFPHLLNSFLVLNHLLHLVLDVILFEVLRLARHQQSVLKH